MLRWPKAAQFLCLACVGPLGALFPSAAPGGQDERALRDDVPMVQVPAGRFLMGGPSGSPNERPALWVYLDAFEIDVHEVTNAQQ